MLGRAAFRVLALIAGLSALGCGSRGAPEDAPALASPGSIPTAAPGAMGVVIPDPRPLAITAGRTPPAPPKLPLIPPPIPTLSPDLEVPLPLPVEPVPPSPFGEPPAKPPKPPKAGKAPPSTELEL